MYLEQRAEEDTLFAKKYRNPAKNIDECVTHILNYVQKLSLIHICGRLLHSWSKLTHSASFPLPAQMDCEKENHLKTRKSTSWHSHKRKGHCIISLNIV